MRWFCRVEYRGTDFAGWQMQRGGNESVQSAIERALATVLRSNIAIMGAGRTDAGVHGRAQGMHFDAPDSIDVLKRAKSINSVLPHGIVLYNFQQVDEDFHARYSARERRYVYTIARRKSPLRHGLSWRVDYTLDWDRMINEAKSILGKHDFTTFCASRTETVNMVCDVREARFEIFEDYATFTIAADRFIYKMVRSLVGTLVDMGRNEIALSMEELIAAKDRSKAGNTAPPEGLVLDFVAYDKEFDL